jgi:hypothetical protein
MTLERLHYITAIGASLVTIVSVGIALLRDTGLL